MKNENILLNCQVNQQAAGLVGFPREGVNIITDDVFYLKLAGDALACAHRKVCFLTCSDGGIIHAKFVS